MLFRPMMMASGPPTCFLLISCQMLLAAVSCARIPSLPDSLRVDSKLVYLDASRYKFFNIHEFISRSDGSIRMNVEDHSKLYSSQQAAKKTYFRLFQGAAKTIEDESLDEEMVALDLESGECHHEHTSSWMLSDYSILLSKIEETIQTDDAKNRNSRERIRIGPTALLQFVYENPALFHLDSRAYEDFLMADCFYFSASIDNFPTGPTGFQSAKLIVSVLADRVEFPTNQTGATSKSELSTLLLSEVHLRQHVAMVSFVLLSNIPGANRLKSSELLDAFKKPQPQKSKAPRLSLMIAYDLIQERSLSRHSGLEYLSDELANPFQLPVACGSLTLQRPLYVASRQFSGQFEALGFEQKFAVAYDQPTNHLRYDSVDEFKLIYSLNEYLATFISTSNQRIDTPSNKYKNEPQASGYYHQAHQNKERCAQTNILYENEPPLRSRSWLYDKGSIADVLGLGDRLGLMYLGQKRLPVDQDDQDDDFMQCQVFEREISAHQIPALLGMHARGDLGKRDFRFFLVFYFVDEINSLRDSETDAWQSMWLKRVELISFDPVHKYQQLESRLTFSSFSWSLDSVQTSDAPTSRQAELTHPAHTFDTLECWSERGQLQVDFLLKQVDEQDWDEALKAGNRLKNNLQMSSSLEESVLVFLERTLMMPRAQINDLDIIAPSVKSDSELQSTESNSLSRLGNLWVTFKLTKPFNYLYKRKLLGWVNDYEELSNAKQAQIVKYKTKMAYHECSSRLATLLGQPHSIYMLHCPNVGCAYLTVDKLQDINYKKFEDIRGNINSARSSAGFEDSFRMCEINQLVKTMSMRQVESDIDKPEVIRRYLSQSSLMIYASDENYESQVEKYRAHVTKLSLFDGESDHDRWHEEVIYGLCYTSGINLKYKDKAFEDKRHGLHVLQLDLDQHHSRAQCGRACLLYQFCQTYSYNRATRQCVLTNIHRHYLKEAKFSLDATKLSGSESCSIYALDNLLLYKRSGRMETRMPVELSEDKNVLLLSLSLSQCASLCHMDELAFNQNKTIDGKAVNCQSFSYLSLHSLCVLKNTGQDLDYKTGLVKREEHLSGPDELDARIGGKQKMYEASAYESYTRAYGTYFASRYGIKVYLNRPTEETENGRLEEVIQGLSLIECQRECSAVREDCAMLDHCLVNKNGIQQEICHLYSMRSPLSLPSSQLYDNTHPATETFKKLQLDSNNSYSNSLLQQLSDSEKLFYVEGYSNKHELLIHSRNCHHFYLDGNNLYLKHLLAKSLGNFLDGKSIRQLAGGDETTNQLGQSSMERPGKLASPIEYNFTSSLQTMSKICIGVIIGMFVFLIQPRVVEVTTNMDLVKLVHSIRWFHSSTGLSARSRSDRSMSMVDIVEMADVDSPRVSM